MAKPEILGATPLSNDQSKNLEMKAKRLSITNKDSRLIYLLTKTNWWSETLNFVSNPEHDPTKMKCTFTHDEVAKSGNPRDATIEEMINLSQVLQFKFPENPITNDFRLYMQNQAEKLAKASQIAPNNIT